MEDNERCGSIRIHHEMHRAVTGKVTQVMEAMSEYMLFSLYLEPDTEKTQKVFRSSEIDQGN